MCTPQVNRRVHTGSATTCNYRNYNDMYKPKVHGQVHTGSEVTCASVSKMACSCRKYNDMFISETDILDCNQLPVIFITGTHLATQ